MRMNRPSQDNPPVIAASKRQGAWHGLFERPLLLVLQVAQATSHASIVEQTHPGESGVTRERKPRDTRRESRPMYLEPPQSFGDMDFGE